MANSNCNHTCSAEGCEREAKQSRHGIYWCPGHLGRVKKHGDPLVHKPLRLGKKICSVDGCDRFVHAHGFCGPHAHKFRRHGDPLYIHPKKHDGERQCIVDGCDRPTQATDYCAMHYERIKNHGEPLPNKPPRGTTVTCTIEGCDRPHDSHGMCNMHVKRLLKHGDPNYTTPIKHDGIRTCHADGCEHVTQTGDYCLKHYTRFIRHGDPNTRKHIASAEGLAFLESIANTQNPECILWPFGLGGRVDDRRGSVTYQGRQRPAYSVAYELRFGPIPDGMICRHNPANCNNGLCVNPLHIVIGTHLENSHDRYIAGTVPVGENHKLAKLTDAIVREARERSKSETIASLAREFGVHSMTMNNAIKGKTWKHVS